MIFHENRLLADDSHKISFLIFSENWKKKLQNLSSAQCSCDWHFKGKYISRRGVGCKAGSPSWAPPSSEQFPPPWERCLNGLLFVTFCAVPLKFNKYYVIKKLADIFVLSLLASLIHVLEHYATYSFY